MDTKELKEITKIVNIVRCSQFNFRLGFIKAENKKHSFIVKTLIEQLNILANQHSSNTSGLAQPFGYQIGDNLNLYQGLISKKAPKIYHFCYLVWGLEKLNQSQQSNFFVNCNIQRNSFTTLAAPLLIIMDIQSFALCQRVAPDFYSWATSKDFYK